MSHRKRSLSALGVAGALGATALAALTGCQTQVLDVISSVDGGLPTEDAGAFPETRDPPSAPSSTARPSPPPSSACTELDGACTSSASCCSLFCELGGPKGGRCALPPGCSRDDERGPGAGAAIACTRAVGEVCLTTAECCAGACTRAGAEAAVFRCTKSAKCAATCEVCERDEDCCAGECKSHKGGPSRCEER